MRKIGNFDSFKLEWEDLCTATNLRLSKKCEKTHFLCILIPNAYHEFELGQTDFVRKF